MSSSHCIVSQGINSWNYFSSAVAWLPCYKGFNVNNIDFILQTGLSEELKANMVPDVLDEDVQDDDSKDEVVDTSLADLSNEHKAIYLDVYQAMKHSHPIMCQCLKEMCIYLDGNWQNTFFPYFANIIQYAPLLCTTSFIDKFKNVNTNVRLDTHEEIKRLPLKSTSLFGFLYSFKEYQTEKFYPGFLRGYLLTHHNTSTNVASVGPRQIGEQVYKVLEPYSVSAALGHVKGVGVGGFTVGGSDLWMTNQAGLSCNTIIAFEVALPTGEVGGGNSFRVVTRINYMAIPQPVVWSGLNIYLEESLDELAEAILKFQDTNKDLKAIIGVTYTFDWLFASVFYYYHGPSHSSSFNHLLTMPAANSTLSTMSLTNLVSTFVGPEVALRVSWHSVSITNYTVSILKTIAELVKSHGPTA
ncbi:fad binding domain-containing protein [Moniliophthora roreri MCA 2997]|uniref:Fad binding domain-containing protein n=1 Tax=Moniliophthora roreri (strain MCA 2997) TaxID=1381753 RepID=V2X2T1_MONRO|nr:fad binding domain-containing protein [Moniliophthora roreri MCA 2997]